MLGSTGFLYETHAPMHLHAGRGNLDRILENAPTLTTGIIRSTKARLRSRTDSSG